MIKLGMIGAGGIARGAHAPALKALADQVKVVAISDLNEAATEELSLLFPEAKTFTDFHDLLNEDLDAVVVTTPNFLHFSMAKAALEAGKHVLCEKPLALNEDEAAQMVQLAKQQGKILMTAFNNRYRDDIQYLKAFINEGKTGPIYHAKCGWIRRSGIPGWGGWFTNKALSGGGPLIDLGVHMLDITLYLLGDLEITSVTGQTYRAFGDKSTSRAWGVANASGTFDVEDFASAFIRLENGSTITLDVSWAANVEEEKVFMQLYGEKAGIQLENGKPLKIFSEHNGILEDTEPKVMFDDPKARRQMWAHFIECIKTGKEPISSGEAGQRINRILDAIYVSSENGKEVSLQGNEDTPEVTA
ncbi:Gfo/Idh/MocA family protein [Priestia koreensis]|uniref:Gfo/Idh/MocA family protein n=1 Tax=Priestia koreensis TaxID=284581 RepID=UPI003D06082D